MVVRIAPPSKELRSAKLLLEDEGTQRQSRGASKRWVTPLGPRDQPSLLSLSLFSPTLLPSVSPEVGRRLCDPSRPPAGAQLRTFCFQKKLGPQMLLGGQDQGAGQSRSGDTGGGRTGGRFSHMPLGIRLTSPVSGVWDTCSCLIPPQWPRCVTLIREGGHEPEALSVMSPPHTRTPHSCCGGSSVEA